MRITAELRAATAEAAGVAKDLRALIRQARALIDEYAAEKLVSTLERSMQTAIERLAQENDKYIETWAEARAGACEEAKAHMAEDWRLACAVNAVGHQVYEALRIINQDPYVPEHTHPELKDDLGEHASRVGGS